MKIIHVVPSIQDEASGPAYSTTMLNRTINDLGGSSRLAVTMDAPRENNMAGDVVLAFPRRKFLYSLGRSPEMHRWLQDEIARDDVDIIHNHSVWMMPNIYPGWVTRGTRASLVVSPHGTFSAWALNRSKTVKRIFWHTLQRHAICHAAMFHATAENEYEDIRRLGFRQPVAVVANGIDIPNSTREVCFGAHRTLLFLSRVHPVKGIEFLLDAWARLQNAHPQWSLRIVGPGDTAYLRELHQRAAALRLERVNFEGPLYGEAKHNAYQCADLFVLPTHSENFGVAIGEALAAGCPVVTTTGAPWSGLKKQRAGWWVDIGIEPIKRALEEAMSKPPEDLAAMGARGRAWIERDYAWSTIATQMIESYRWMREGGAKPSWIYDD